MDLSRIGADDLPVDVGFLHLTRILGTGSSGTTFGAKSRGVGELPSQVALTVLPVEALSDERRWRDLQTEVSRAALLRHRGIVRILSFAEHSRPPYVTQELAEGPDLARLIRHGGVLEPRQLLDLGIQLLSALGGAHLPTTAGGVPLPHGALRPSAVILGGDGKARLRGFGLRLVRGSHPVGTSLAFASPEALSSQPLNLGTDLFSLAGVLYFAALGRVPFVVHEGASVGEQLAASVRGLRSGTPLADIDRVVPGLGAVFARMLCLEPESRFQDVAEVEALFRELRGTAAPCAGLGEVVADRWGTQLSEESTFDDTDPVADYLSSGISVSRSSLRRMSREETLAPRTDGKDGALSEAATLSPADGQPGVLEDDSRSVGAPAPPPIPVPRRALVAAPRQRPTVIDPGDATLPEAESFRPASGGDRYDGPAHTSPPGSPAAISSHRAPTDLLPELSLDNDFGDETTDVPGVVGSRPLHLAPTPSAVQGPSEEVARSLEAVLRMEPAGDGVRSGAAGGSAPPKANSSRERMMVGGSLVVILLSSLVFFIKFGGGFVAERENPPRGLATSSAAPAPAQVAPTGRQTPSEDSVPAVAITTPPSTGSVGGSSAAEPGQGEPLEVDRVGTLPVEGPVRGQRGSGATALGDSSSTGGGETVSSDRRERRRPAPVPLMKESAPETSSSGPPIDLVLRHKPITKARVGSSELVSVRMDAPRSAKVTLTAGPAGGPFKRSRLKAKSGGRWEGWIDFRGVSAGDEFRYWVTATHPRATSTATSGSRATPHRVVID